VSNEHSIALQVIQVTDSHLRGDEDGTLLGMNTRASLEAVLELIERNGHEPDLVVATGDIAQDGSEEAYQCFQDEMSQFSCPVYWFLGNHDHNRSMVQIAAGTEALDRVVVRHGWKLIFLDSSVPGKVYGRLGKDELRLLEEELSADSKLHVLICFHHHPIDIGSAWLDNIGLRNRDEFLAIIDRHDNVRGVLWGHIHQEIDVERNGVRMLASPSTCVQFKPKTKNFAVDTVAPGYRWLNLMRDGRIETGVNRAEHIEFVIDLNSKGY
jgi:3',5'-cyclic-AMP phosphodiesterase